MQRSSKLLLPSVHLSQSTAPSAVPSHRVLPLLPSLSKCGHYLSFTVDERLVYVSHDRVPSVQIQRGFKKTKHVGPRCHRLEPLAVRGGEKVRPMFAPYHRGGRRLHIGLQVPASLLQSFPCLLLEQDLVRLSVKLALLFCSVTRILFSATLTCGSWAASMA